jgi:RHS repeat-associated protein
LDISKQEVGGEQYISAMSNEWYIYGSSGHGRFARAFPVEGDGGYDNLFYDSPEIQSRYLKHKQYELKDHLGNVRVVVSDFKYSTTSGTDDPPYRAEVLAAYNYYPFGMLQPGMYKENDNLRYRFGFNGMLRDDDVTDKLSTGPDEGRGNSYDFGARMYNPRVTRFFSLDPLKLKYPSMSPYIFAVDNPVVFVDEKGKDGKDVTKKASEYLGTPYEYGGKNPITIGGYPLGLSRDDLDKILQAAPITRASNENYTSEEYLDEYPVLLTVKASQSLGIDCSGHAIIAFNADPDKRMPDFNIRTTNATALKSAFQRAQENGLGVLDDDFKNIQEGDLVFNPPLKNGKIPHVMIATGNVRDKLNKKGEVVGMEVEVLDTRSTGKDVSKHYKNVKSGMSFGRPNRVPPPLPPIDDSLSGSPKK